MKTTSKRGLIATTLSLFMLAILASCGEIANAFSNGRDFTKADDVQDLEELIIENITPEMEVIEIVFNKADMDASMFSNSKGLAQIHYVDAENAKKKKVLCVDLKDKTVYEDPSYNEREHFRKYKGVKVEKLGCAKIADNVNAAINLLAADSLFCSGIGSYSIELDAKPEKIKHKFSLERRTGSGNRQVYYDEYSFVADLEGNVKSRK